ncbi:hypothetical protein EBR78_06955 [bacterium]|nr:hypothetical protein [bacterium]NBX82259.1 hypothetical protein [bacterium]
MSKPTFRAEWPPEIQKAVKESVQKTQKALKRSSKPHFDEEMQYQPSKLSPLNYVILKVLQGQWEHRSFSVLPLTIGMTRKTLSQVKRLLSHGSL